MQRLETLLQKLTDLSRLKDKATPIEIDLMMDYTRVIYADLIEWRNRTNFVNAIPIENVASAQPVTMANNKRANIQSYIGINDKYQFISELFNNDSTVYSDVINTLNSLETNIQAVNWLQSNYHWDDDNETAQSFYKLINDYFKAV
jgi:hypothetical protein